MSSGKSKKASRWKAVVRKASAGTITQDAENAGSTNGTGKNSGKPAPMKSKGCNSLANAEPELVITVLRNPSAKNYRGLRNLLEKASKEWLEEFLQLNGFPNLISALNSVSKFGRISMTDALMHLELVGCIKAVMNTRLGMEYLVQSMDDTKQLLRLLETPNVAVKKQIFELLCAVSIYNSKGHLQVMQALEFIRATKSYRFRFSIILNELTTAELTSYKTTLVAFINCLILGCCEDFKERVKLRREFTSMGLQKALEDLRNSEDEELCIQCAVFDDHENRDELMAEELGVELSSNYHKLFDALHDKIAEGPRAYQFLTLLHNLIYWEDSKKPEPEIDKVWKILIQVTDSSSTRSMNYNTAIAPDTTDQSTQTLPPVPRYKAPVWTTALNSVTKKLNVFKTSGIEVSVQTEAVEIPTPVIQTQVKAGRDTSPFRTPMAVSMPPPPPPMPGLSLVPPPPPLPEGTAISPPRPPPMPGMSMGPPPSPPMPGMSAAPPPPPLMPGMAGPPPPPPMPGMAGGPPPPPPMPGMSMGPPPPPPMPGMSMGPPPPPPMPGMSMGPPPPPPMPGMSMGPPPPPPMPGMSMGPPPPPPMPGMFGGPPPPPPMPGMFGGPPPPPPMPGMAGGPPPPPPMPGMAGGPPPPPPMPGMAGGPPPPPMPGIAGGPPPPPPMSGMVGGPPPPPPPMGEVIPPPVQGYQTYQPALAQPGNTSVPTNIFAYLPKPKIKTKKLNWTKVPNQVINGSIWGDIINTYAQPTILLMQSHVEEAESLFCEKQKETVTAKESVAKSAIPAKVALLDGRRSMNIDIFLKQFRTTHAAIVAMIRDGMSDVIGAERLRGLLDILPIDGEIELVKSYEGELEQLASAEQFFKLVIAVPSFRLRTEAMFLKEDFKPAMQSIKANLEIIVKAANDFLSNTSFKAFLAFVLSTGNFLNTGSYAGNAAGFKLSILERLYDTKANKPRMTLLHFVLDVVEQEHSDWLTFPNDFKNLPAAARLSLDQLTGDMAELNKSVTKLTKQIEGVGKTSPDIITQFQDFLKSSQTELTKAQEKITEAKDLETKLAQQFCEERSKFTLDEFFKSMNLFCEKMKVAQTENSDRRKREARQAAIKAKQDEDKGKVNGAGGVGGMKKLKSTPIPTNNDKSIVDMLLDDIKKGSFDLKRTQR